MAFIKIYDEQSQNTNYIVNTDNVCYVKDYVVTKIDEKKNKEGLDYYLEVYFTSGEKVTFYFKTSESFEHYVQQFKNLTKEENDGKI